MTGRRTGRSSRRPGRVRAAPGGELPGDPDAAIRQLYSHYAKALHGYVEQVGSDQASADDIVQETFIRAWRHLPQLSADNRPIRLGAW
jgi:DNA-directed RNA polymerase specialized sigma24 family protein